MATKQRKNAFSKNKSEKIQTTSTQKVNEIESSMMEEASPLPLDPNGDEATGKKLVSVL
jgi:hypothetical protein